MFNELDADGNIVCPALTETLRCNTPGQRANLTQEGLTMKRGADNSMRKVLVR